MATYEEETSTERRSTSHDKVELDNSMRRHQIRKRPKEKKMLLCVTTVINWTSHVIVT